MRKTHTLVKVMDALMEDPSAKHWGYELSKRTGVRSGALYPILQRLLDGGLLTDGWEDPDEIRGKRPARRYYRVTGEGADCMRRVLAEAATDVRFRVPIGQGM